MTASLESLNLELAEQVSQFYADPLGFVMFAFPWGQLGPLEHEAGPDKWQREFLIDLGNEVRARGFTAANGFKPVLPIRMAVASGHGIGKSALMAMIHWWIMCTRMGCRGTVTANTFPQLDTKTWAEIRRWWEMLICRHWFEVTGTRASLKAAPAKQYSNPLTCDEHNSEAFSGQHVKDSTSFYEFDESSKIPDSIFEAAETSMTDGEPIMIVVGNPTRNTGTFYEICFGSQRHRWNVRSIDSRTCKFPNHALHAQWIQDHGIDSDYVRVRVLGLPPRTSELQLIGKDLVEAAQQRVVYALHDDPLVAGVDVPDGGSAWFVIRFRRGLDGRPGLKVPAPIRVAGSQIDRKTMINICAEVMNDQRYESKVAAMFIDSAFGAPIVERLHVLGFDNVHEVSFGGKSPDPQNFANMRAFMWAREMKSWLERGAIDPEDKKLASDLMAPGFHNRLGGDGALVVESKDDMRGRGIDSPDDGDALALTFAQPVAPVIERTYYRPAPRSQRSGYEWMNR